jgi:hypothetical protein
MLSDNVREALAQYAHDTAWSGWMRYLFSKCTINEDGSVTMPAWAVERWTRQMNTPYVDLPESERASDREQADMIIAKIVQASAAEAEANRQIAELSNRQTLIVVRPHTFTERCPSCHQKLPAACNSVACPFLLHTFS